jgi:glucose/mannose-6-phosphate isomerase
VPWLHPDSENLLVAAAGLGDQVAAAVRGYVALPAGLRDAADTTSVVIAGMGGSAVAGEVLQAYAAQRASVPVIVVDSGSAPRFLGPGTLVFAVSFSGNTEETLAVASAALSAAATVVAVTCEGPLERLVAAGGGAVMRLDYGPTAFVTQPRAAVGASIAVLLLACEQLGVLPEVRSDLLAVCEQLGHRRESLSSGEGISAEIALQIGRTIPVFHGASGLAAVAARRWKTQVNENAKAPAYFGVQPEVCHNEVCGFGQHGDVTRQVLTLVNLRTGLEDERMSQRFRLFAELTDEALSRVVDVEAAGEGELARFFDLVMIGDFVSLHLAAREGIDPGPVPTLAELKLRLGRES